MSNGDDQQENCILGVCCNPEKRRHALALKIARELHVAEPIAEKVAGWVNDHYDLAPKDSLSVLKYRIAELARGFPYE